MPRDDEPTAIARNGHEHELDVRQKAEAEEALGEKLSDYAGRWVAVENHAVIADANELNDLVGRLNGQRTTAVLFRVEDDPAATHLA